MNDRETASMAASTGRSRIGLAGLLVLLVLMLAGCGTMDKETEHRILTFFFTGVPPLEQAQGTGAADQGEAIGAQGITSEPESAEAEPEPEPQSWVHGPVAANQCDLCHTVAASQGLSSVNVQGAANRLVMPVEELCVSCHETKSAAAAEEQGLQMHPPVAIGLCIHCHEPHRANRRFLLRAEDNRTLCMGCHYAEVLPQTDAHVNSDMDCMLCHNPHMGQTSTMLRMDFDEAVDRYAE